jgi:hypothetical protein
LLLAAASAVPSFGEHACLALNFAINVFLGGTRFTNKTIKDFRESKPSKSWVTLVLK